MKIKCYQLPFTYDSDDRFYVETEGVFGELPNPVYEKDNVELIKDVDGNDKKIRNWTIQIVNAMSAGLIAPRDIDFNYVIIEGLTHQNKTKTCWFVSGREELVAPDNYLVSLKLDIFMTFPLLKNVDDLELEIERESLDEIRALDVDVIKPEDNKKYIYTKKRNPKVWNNNDFDSVNPIEMKTRDISLLTFFNTNGKWADGSFKYELKQSFYNITFDLDVDFIDSIDTPNASSLEIVINKITKKYTIEMSAFLPILQKMLKVSQYEYKGASLNDMATISKVNKNSTTGEYDASFLMPIIYNRPSIYKLNEYLHIVGDDKIGYVTYDKDINVSANQGSPTRNPFKLKPEPYDYSNNPIIRKILGNDDQGNPINTFTCKYGNTIDVSSRAFGYTMNRFLLALEKNHIENVESNKYVSGIFAYTSSIFDFIQWTNIKLGGDSVLIKRVKELRQIWEDKRTKDSANVLYGIGQKVPEEPITLPKGKSNFIDIFKTNETEYFDNYPPYKIHHIKPNNDWLLSKYKENNRYLYDFDYYKVITPQLFNDVYNPTWLEIAGHQIPLDKFQMYLLGFSVIKKLGINEEAINVMQSLMSPTAPWDSGVGGDIHQPQWLQRISLSIPIEYSKNVGEINYQLRKNYFDAKLSEANLNRQATIRYIDEIANGKILQNNASTAARNTAITDRGLSNIDIAGDRSQQSQDKAYEDYITNPISWVREVPANLADIMDFWYGRTDKRFSPLDSQVKQIQSDYDTETQGIINSGKIDIDFNKTQRKINNAVVRNDARAAARKARSDANIKKLIVNAEIADLRAMPRVVQNSSNVSTLLPMNQSIVSFNEKYLNQTTQKRIWRFFNMYGENAFGLFETKNEWWKKHLFFNYFKGGDWTRYLYKIGITNIELVSEFNNLMGSGLRLWNRKNLNSKLGKDNYDIVYNAPNWTNEMVDEILKS